MRPRAEWLSLRFLAIAAEVELGCSWTPSRAVFPQVVYRTEEPTEDGSSAHPRRWCSPAPHGILCRLVSKVRTVLHNTLWMGLDQVIGFLLFTTTSILVARDMGPSKLGHYNYVLWIAQMTAALGSFGVPEAARIFLADRFGKREPNEVRAILRWSLKFQAMTAFASVAVGVALTIALGAPEHRLYTTLAVLSVFPAALMGLATAVNLASEDFGTNTQASIAGILVQTSGILATLVWKWDLTGLAASLLAGRTVDSGLRWVLLGIRFPRYLRSLSEEPSAPATALPPTLRRDLMAFSARSTGLLVINLVVWSRSEVFFLKRFCDIRQLAFFSVAFSFAALAGRLAEPMSWASGAGLLVEHGRDPAAARRFAVTFLRYLALLVLPATLGLSVLGGPLIRVFYGAAYAPAAPVLALAAALAFVPSLAPPFQTLITAAGGQRLVLRVSLTAAALTLALDYWLVSSHCALGGALANGLGQGTAALGLLFVAQRHFGFLVPWPFLGRLAAIAATTAACVWALTTVVADFAAVALGPPLGVLVFLGLLRASSLLNAEDQRRLVVIGESLPGPLRAGFVRIIAWVGA